MNQSNTPRQTMTHAQKAAEKVAAMFQSRSNCPPVSDFEFVIREHCEKPAVDELEAKLREMEAEMDLKAEPNPNGGLAARLNWWKQQSDMAHDNWQKSESARMRAVEATRELREKLQSANELIESVKSHAIDVNDEFLQKLLEK